jgi:uncharacterized protein (DUF1330 family)
MPAYVIVDVAVTNPEGYAAYRTLSGPSVEQYGGRFLVRGGAVEALEGEWLPTRLVVIEFGSVTQAKTWYASPEYTEARRVRQGAANFKMIVVEGVA